VVAAGSILGFLLLGIGGRIGMRVIALAQGQAPGASLGGSLTVVMLGAAAGAAIAGIFLLAHILFPTRRVPRAAFFWITVVAIALRGLSPVSVLNAAVFLPLFIAHGGLLFGYWCRFRMPRVSVPGVVPTDR
jgi:hypothetical protein